MKYFLHDTSSMQDEKITELFINFGYTGTGLFFAILEKIAFAESPVSEKILMFQLKIKGKKLLTIYSFLIESELLFKQKDCVFNENVLKVSEKYKINKEKNRKRVSEWRKNQEDNENVTHSEQVRNNDVTHVKKIKVNKIKVNKIKENNKEEIEDGINYNEVLEFFNSTCKSIPNIKKITKQRKESINARAKEYNYETIGEVFKIAEESDYLSGRTATKWNATFDWLLNPTNFLKVIEGNYKNKNNEGNISSTKNSKKGATRQEITEAVWKGIEDLPDR